MPNKEQYKSQFNIPFDPSIDNLDLIVILGYDNLTSTDKLIYLTIVHLFRDGDKISNSILINIFPKCERSIYYCLKRLKELELIRYRGSLIYPCAPDCRNTFFEKAMKYLAKHT